MNRCNGMISALIAAGLSLCGAAAQAPGNAETVLMPTRAIGATHNCAGYYPKIARRLSQTGDVLVRYDVRADGAIAHVTLGKSSGVAALDDAALHCVATAWRNTPALRNGVAVASPGHMAAIQFRLDTAAPPDPRDSEPVAKPPLEHPVLNLLSYYPDGRDPVLSIQWRYIEWAGGILLALLAAVIVNRFFRRRTPRD